MGASTADQLTLELEARLPRLPDDLRPMLPRPADEPFDDPTWTFEPSWDGLRALAHLDGGRVRLRDARGRELADRFPELLGLVDAVSGIPLLLDGEVIVPDADGRPDPDALQRRLRPTDGARRARSRVGQASYLVNDALYRDGRSLLREPLSRRRRALEELVRGTDRLVVVPAVVGEGRSLFDAIAAQSLPAMLARRADSPYLPGVRSELWRRIRTRGRFDAVVGGYHSAADGSLSVLLGAWEDPEPDGSERFVAVGSAVAAGGSTIGSVLERALRSLATEVTPFRRGAKADQRWVRPELVVTVEHEGWADGRLVHPRLVAVRDDLEARGCRVPRPPADQDEVEASSRPVLALLQRLPIGD